MTFLIFILLWPAITVAIAVGAGTCMDRMGKGWV